MTPYEEIEKYLKKIDDPLSEFLERVIIYADNLEDVKEQERNKLQDDIDRIKSVLEVEPNE